MDSSKWIKHNPKWKCGFGRPLFLVRPMIAIALLAAESLTGCHDLITLHSVHLSLSHPKRSRQFRSICHWVACALGILRSNAKNGAARAHIYPHLHGDIWTVPVMKCHSLTWFAFVCHSRRVYNFNLVFGIFRTRRSNGSRKPHRARYPDIVSCSIIEWHTHNSQTEPIRHDREKEASGPARRMAYKLGLSSHGRNKWTDLPFQPIF